mmetsp:Transcript_51991/g.118474  ORF Transcript_51991/g.118474 Transcript_51991/m.118474 type:complete len:225 (+) Transcript_51991:627-1301(+)
MVDAPFHQESEPHGVEPASFAPQEIHHTSHGGAVHCAGHRCAGRTGEPALNDAEVVGCAIDLESVKVSIVAYEEFDIAMHLFDATELAPIANKDTVLFRGCPLVRVRTFKRNFACCRKTCVAGVNTGPIDEVCSFFGFHDFVRNQSRKIGPFAIDNPSAFAHEPSAVFVKSHDAAALGASHHCHFDHLPKDLKDMLPILVPGNYDAKISAMEGLAEVWSGYAYF